SSVELSQRNNLEGVVKLSQRKLFFVCFEELVEVNRFGDFTGRVFLNLAQSTLSALREFCGTLAEE
ncbi:MAG: hypothetical protein ACI30O_01860, partial [Muribaculaceae bacterium]